jgi:hypothetical protein
LRVKEISPEELSGLKKFEVGFDEWLYVKKASTEYSLGGLSEKMQSSSLKRGGVLLYGKDLKTCGRILTAF